ncbi:MAG: hypothetical protein EBQ49_01795 [Verrucomicrobia bacterium]|nr:hypothetical protein [Verrucomicrobiota bacterium]
MAHPILDNLSGFPLKVSEALHALDKAWADEGEEASRASQMNLILMFGAKVTPADAQARLMKPFYLPSVILVASLF